MFYFVILIAVFLVAPSQTFAHGMVWAKQSSQIQWGVVTGVLIGVTTLYVLFKAILKKWKRIDLLENKYIEAFMKSKFYPAIFQIPALIVFTFIFYRLFIGSYYYSENPGAILVWTLWWALLPFSFILIGRIWCAVCPFAWISDIVQKYVGRRKPVPLWISKYSFWIVDGIFILITWFDRVFKMTDRPFHTGLVFVGLLIGVIVFGFLYERRAFCRYVCFLGNVAGTYSMAAPFELKSKNLEICKTCKEKACILGIDGKPGCPLYQFIPTKQGNRFCTLCASCVKACPHNNIALEMRPFGTDFWNRLYVTFDESFFAKMLVGIVILQNIGMLTLWTALNDFVSRVTGITNEIVVFTLIYALTISVPLGLMFISSFFSAKAGNEGIIKNFARFGYAFVAVDLAGHLAHNLNHFFGEGKTIIAAFAGMFSNNVKQTILQWLLNFGTVQVFQYMILGLGVVGTFIITYKIASKTAKTHVQLIKTMAPHLILLSLLMIFNFYIFSQPMLHRSQNI